MSNIKTHFTFLCFFLVVLLTTGSFAQDSSRTSSWQTTPNAIIETFDQTDGLPTVSLSDIVVGADGYLYVASYAGLSRFDGTQFELITSEKYPALKSNRILHLYAAPDSAIWIDDEERQISRWKHGKLTTFDYLQPNDDGYWQIKISESGSVLAKRDSTIRMFKEGSGFQQISHRASNSIIDFVPISDSEVWMLTQNSLSRVNGDSLTSHLSNPDLQCVGTTNGSMKILSGNRLAVYNTECVLVYDTKSNISSIYNFENPLTTIPLKLLEIDDNHLLISNFTEHYELEYGNSVIQKIPETENLYSGSATYNPLWQGKRLYITYNKVIYDGHVIYNVGPGIQIRQAVQDREGNLWLSTSGHGLKRISISPFQVLNTSNGLYGDNIYSIIEDRNKDIWLGASDAGVHRISENQIDLWTGNSMKSNELIRSLYQSANGDIFTSIWYVGVRIFNGKKWKIFDDGGTTPILTKSTIEAYFEDENGTFWLGGRQALYKKTNDSESFAEVLSADGQPVKGVRIISQDADHRLWFGTNRRGIFLKRDTTLSNIGTGFLQELAVRDIFAERANTLWIATEQKGLIRATVDGTGVIKSHKALTKEDGLPDIGVHRVLADPYGYFWLSSNQGLSRINERSLNQYLDGKSPQIWIQTFTENDGLPIREANGGTQSCGIVASDSTLWIPTQRGVVRFDPADFLDENPYEFTKINVSRIETQDQSYELFGANAIELQKDERTLNLAFRLLHFVNPQNLELEYRVKSLETGWQKLTEDRQLNITHIPPGNHQIETRLAGVPNVLHPGASFSITVPPFFYEETWFYFLAGCIGLSLLGLGYLYMARAAKRRERILNKKVDERTKLLQEQKVQTEEALETIQKQAKELEQLNEVKNDFFINVIHELRTPLTLIQGPLNLLKKASNNRDIDREVQLKRIEQNSDNLNKLVQRLLNLIRMEAGDINDDVRKIDLIQFIRNQASQFESSEELAGKNFEIDLPSSSAYVMANPHSLESVINNLISNAIKYTNKGDSISITVEQTDERVIAKIKDTGVGIHEDDLGQIFDPFFRSENGESSAKGSGIGLSIVDRYMRQIGGDVEIESELGVGTTIFLTFSEVNSGIAAGS